MYTFLPAEEVKELGRLKDQEINRAKEMLAFEITKIVHGEVEASKAMEGAKAAFSQGEANPGDRAGIPAVEVELSELENGINVIALFSMTSLCSSNAEARRLITQGGARINEKKIESCEEIINQNWIENGEMLLKAGKKRYFRILAKG